MNVWQQSTEPSGVGREDEQNDLDLLYPVVYDELRRIAHRQLGGERPGHTLCTTALVHEAYLRLADQTGADWTNRARFFALAAVSMRRILIDHARKHRTAKRGGALRRVPLESADLPVEERAELLLALDEALTRLAAHDERRCKVVECRFFAGLTEAETAAALGLGLRTVKRDWARARSWLYQDMYPDAIP